MDIVSEKAESIKKNIFKYCDQRCKGSKEFHAKDLTTPEMKDYIKGIMGFVFGRMDSECWGLNDLHGKKCPDKTRAALFDTKYKSRAGAVKACQSNINTNVIMGIFDEVWDKCVMKNKE